MHNAAFVFLSCQQLTRFLSPTSYNIFALHTQKQPLLKLLELVVAEIQLQDARVWTEKQEEYYTSRLNH